MAVRDYAAHRQAMRETLASWVDSVAEFAGRRGIPAVLGEASSAAPRS
ncbi:hypothetical protein ACF1HJ_11375 [Streptomyces sp. NPDC013978]